MDTRKLHEDLQETKTALIQVWSAIPEQRIDTAAAPGSWSTGQVGEHVLKSIEGLPAVLHGKTAPAERAADALVPQLKQIFLDYSTKLKSPEFILPTAATHDKAAMQEALTKYLDQIMEALDNLDPALLCLDFSFPVMGHLTRFELCTFAWVHTQRHLQQLERIAAALPV